MVYGAALEKRWVAMPRGFESHPLRHNLPRRGAGVAYQARLESACRLWRPWVRIPPSPPNLRITTNFINTLGQSYKEEKQR